MMRLAGSSLKRLPIWPRTARFSREDARGRRAAEEIQIEAKKELAKAAASISDQARIRTTVSGEVKRIKISVDDITRVLKRAAAAKEVLQGRRVLWLDDHPTNNTHETRALQQLGLTVVQTQTNAAALEQLQSNDPQFDVVISDVGRADGEPTGIDFLKDCMALEVEVPVIFYIAAVDQTLPNPPGSFGLTNRPDELVHLVIDALERAETASAQSGSLRNGVASVAAPSNRKRSLSGRISRLKPLLSAASGILTALVILAAVSAVIWHVTRTTSDSEVVADIAWRDGIAWRARLSDEGNVELDAEQPAHEDEPPLPRQIMADIRGHASAITSVRFLHDGRILETIDQDGRVVETDIDRLMTLINLPSYQTLQQAKRAAEVEIGRAYGERSIAAIQNAYGWIEAPASPQRSPRAVGKVFRDCAECPEMVVIPAGSFVMGSPEKEARREDDEGPQRTVRIGQPFALGKYEVTFAEWDACVAAGGCSHEPGDQGWGREDRPVINVSWNDAQGYVKWLSEKTGESYRLPSEAEWEYAARAGTVTSYFWGENGNDGCAYANGADLTAKSKHADWSVMDCEDGYYRTAPVGTFRANDWGLHDMQGNVWEWVKDCWNESYAGAPINGTSWLKGDCSLRVVRGGSWNYRLEYLRSASRNGNPRFLRDYNLGFRVARKL